MKLPGGSIVAQKSMRIDFAAEPDAIVLPVKRGTGAFKGAKGSLTEREGLPTPKGKPTATYIFNLKLPAAQK